MGKPSLIRKAAAAAALAGLAAPAAASESFDLLCTSKTETIRYRVDLARGEWCWEQCAGTWKLSSVTSTRITFKDEDTTSGRAYAYVDRVTGRWYQASISRRFGSAVNEGACELAPFTGFGEEKVKF